MDIFCNIIFQQKEARFSGGLADPKQFLPTVWNIIQAMDKISLELVVSESKKVLKTFIWTNENKN